MENAVATRSCGRQKTTTTRRQSGIASSTRTAAPRPHPERQPPAGISPSAASFDEAQCNYPKGIPMDTVTAISERRLEALPDPLRAPAATKMLTVTATYLLSEEGRKASLLDGGDGKAVQQISLQVPANRLHLVSVDAHGVARLKLRPRYLLDDNGIVRIDTAPTYDTSPDVEELFREAARNHQLE